MASRRDFLVVLSGRIATALIAIASLRITTSLLTPGDYGIFALLGTFQSFCGLFLVNPVGQHINRHTHAWWDDGTLFKRLAKFNRYLVWVAIFISIVVVFWWLSYLNIDNNLIMSLVAGTVTGAVVYSVTWNGTFVYILNMLGFRSSSVTWSTATSILSLAFAATFVVLYPSAVTWILGQSVGAAVGGLGAWIYLRRHKVACKTISYQTDTIIDLLDRKTIMTFCIPLAAATGLMWLQNAGYRFWVGSVWGVAELGILTVGLGISNQLSGIAENLASQFFYPYFYRHITEAQTETRSGEALSDLVNVLGPVYIILAGFNALFAKVLLTVLTNNRYHGAVVFVMFGSMIELTRCLTNLSSNAAQVKRRTKGVILPWGLGTTSIFCGLLFISFYRGSINTFAMVLVGASFITCTSMIFIMNKLLPIRIDVRRWAAGFTMMIICVIVAVIFPIAAQGFFQNLGILFLGGVLACICLAAMLWRNPALTRLLSVPLRSV